MDLSNSAIQSRRFLDPANIKVQLKDGEEEKKEPEEEQDGKGDSSKKGKSDMEEQEVLEPGEKEELEQIKAIEKTVSIRMCNYSMLMKAQ